MLVSTSWSDRQKFGFWQYGPPSPAWCEGWALKEDKLA